jgi:hypothetical protein
MADQSFGGPYVQVAAICATPLIEQQGFLSVIRIQDRIAIGGITDQMPPQALNNFALVLSLRAGEMRGKYTVRVTPTSPTGKVLPHLEFPVFFEGEERGFVTALPLNVVAEEEGLYWLDITLEGAVLTRMPFRVMYQKMQMFPGMPFPQPKHD